MDDIYANKGRQDICSSETCSNNDSTQQNENRHSSHNARNSSVPLFYCMCSVCQIQAKNKVKKPVTPAHRKSVRAQKLGILKSFTWLLEEIGNHSQGLNIRIFTPDIVAFRKARIAYLIQPKGERSWRFNTNLDHVSLTEIMKKFTKVVRERKALIHGQNNKVIAAEIYGKEIALLRYTAKDRDNDHLDNNPLDEDGPLRVLNEREFFNLMYERLGSAVWKKLVYIQTIIRCKGGLGDVIIIEYFTTDKFDPAFEAYIDYVENEEQLMNDNPIAYCEIICRRIAAILYFHSSLEILKMRAEFMKDDLGKIWFSYATDILVREIQLPKTRNKPPDAKLSDKDVKELNMALDYHVAQDKLSPTFYKYNGYMEDYYKNVKVSADIERVLEAPPATLISEDTKRAQVELSGRSFFAERSVSSEANKSMFMNDSYNSARTRKRVKTANAPNQKNLFKINRGIILPFLRENSVKGHFRTLSQQAATS
ncbi:unnamed protein product [Blepharisma stoltei]|uniref:Uncharacterized protein n=1 Tax=Blepharisma stoltei TaxID=1481888 RepID=A0AAU9K7V5_9CILI|nr:unnamed protein product [Blepharisma stoltei]